MCGQLETTDHIIFHCALAQFAWCFCRDSFDWSCSPLSVENFQEQFLESADKKNRAFLCFLFGCVAWSLWLIRNEFVFRNVLVSSPDVCVFRIISFMQKWEVLTKTEDRVVLAQARQKLVKERREPSQPILARLGLRVYIYIVQSTTDYVQAFTTSGASHGLALPYLVLP